MIEPNHSVTAYTENEVAMMTLGAKLAPHLQAPCIVHLQGPLGAGKTTLVRGLLRALGHEGTVKSPTYTLVEQYQLAAVICYHFDLYRLTDPEELEAIGFRDYLEANALCFIEWPERGLGWLPEPDVRIVIQAKGLGRSLTIEARHTGATALLHALNS